MNQTAIKTIKENKLLNFGDAIIIGVSGGADSMALLNMLINLKSEYNLKLYVCHINHCLRGNQSEKDMIFVENYCKQNNIECFVLKKDINSLAKQKNISIELCAREVRYDFFNTISTRYSGKIATAHNLNDNIETLILNLTRGSGLKGLCGIPVKRDNIIRPLINCTRHQIENYCNKNNIDFVIDSTNLQDIYTRNHIRLNILPELCKINPNYLENISRTISLINQDETYINKTAQDIFEKNFSDNKINLNALYSLDNAILNRIIYYFLKNFNLKISNNNISYISQIICEKQGKLNIEKNKFIEFKDGFLYYYEHKKSETEYFEFPFKLGEFFSKTNEKYNSFVLDINDYNNFLKNNKKPLYISIDYDKIKCKLVLRQKITGDKICLPYKNCTKTIKKLFNEYKIDLNQRLRLFLLTDNNKVIALEEFGCDKSVEVTDNTKNVLIIQKCNVKKEKNNGK